MSLRKGIPYLVQAFRSVNHPRKSLTFAGAASPQLQSEMSRRGLWPNNVHCIGHVPQSELKSLMSKSHVMVLPSIEEGFGMVLAQAMACGCPVIASQNTGAEDLYHDGDAGFIVPVRDTDALTQRLQQLADQPALRQHMGQRALAQVQSMGGWDSYGDKALAIYQALHAS